MVVFIIKISYKFTEVFFQLRKGSTSRKDELLYSIFAYLTIFRLNELSFDDYKLLVLVRKKKFYI